MEYSKQYLYKRLVQAKIFIDTYEELSAKGVEFIIPPTETPSGISANFKDNSGNWFSLTQASGK